MQPRSKTGYRGVYYNPNYRGKTKRYVARLKGKGRNLYLGLFATAEEAARAWDRKAIEVYGESAVLNFPREEYTTPT